MVSSALHTLLEALPHLATAQRGARRSPRCQSRHTGQGPSGSQQLLAPFLLLRIVPPVESGHVGRQ